MIKKYEEFGSVYDIPDTIIWYMKTKDFDEIPFYHGKKGDENPLETVSDFDDGDNWIIDCKDTTGDFYLDFPEDDSFVLIPKDDVIDVWFEDINMRRDSKKYNL